MITNGIATIFVSDMDRAVRFYTETLGLRLTHRFGDHWASVEAGRLIIGLHPASDANPAGRPGSVHLGFTVEGSIDEAVETLRGRGVRFTGPVTDDKSGKFVPLADPDGNPLYLYEVRQDYAPAREWQEAAQA